MLATMLSKGAQRQVQIGNIRTNLYDMFKEHSSITVKSFVNSILSRLKVKTNSCCWILLDIVFLLELLTFVDLECL